MMTWNITSVEARRRMGSLRRSHKLTGPLCIRQEQGTVSQGGQADKINQLCVDDMIRSEYKVWYCTVLERE